MTYLLHCGANVNSQNKVVMHFSLYINQCRFVQSMRTPLLMAAWHGHATAVSFLVSKGADVNLKDKVYVHVYDNCNRYHQFNAGL